MKLIATTISPSLICKALTTGNVTPSIHVDEGIPADSELVGAELTHDRQVRLTFRSDSLADVPDGSVIPRVPILLSRINPIYKDAHAND